MNGIIGSSGTTIRSLTLVIAVPLVGGLRLLKVGIAASD
jgi:hypothetical protein